MLNASLLFIFPEKIRSNEKIKYEAPVIRIRLGLSSMIFCIGVSKPMRTAGIIPARIILK